MNDLRRWTSTAFALTFTLALAFALTWAGCSRDVRFADRAILWHDPDDRPIPKPPRRRDPEVNWAGARDALFHPADRVLGLDYAHEAANVNALDEVPDSAWFLDLRRVPGRFSWESTRQPLGYERVARGPVGDEDLPVPPFTVLQGKVGGSAGGIVVRDARGVKYLLKLDPVGHVGLVTSTEVVATRLTWAAGWRVPAESLVDLDRAQLQLAPDAWMLDRWRRKIRFDPEQLDLLLASSGRTPEGKVRALASRWLPGEALGQFAWMGRDPNDPNDRVPHEDRRDLRGFGVLAAWINDVDTMQNNTLDTYVGAPGHGHVVHWQQDVGGSFGSFAARFSPYWMGQETYFSTGKILASLFTLGAPPRKWEAVRVREAHDRALIEWPELGFFDGAHFDPKGWHPILDNPAFVRMTARDRYWGAKRLLDFDAAELRGAVSAGRYRPEAADRVVGALLERRQKLLRWGFSGAMPLDRFRFDGRTLCFEDLWVQAGLGDAVEYRVRGARPVGRTRCLSVQPGGYRVVELSARRAGERKFGRDVRIHLDGAHLVGVER